jgi:hypothetical protein
LSKRDTTPGTTAKQAKFAAVLAEEVERITY